MEKPQNPRVAEDLIVACPRVVFAPEKNWPPPPTITYTTKRQYVLIYISKPPQSETPAANTRCIGFSHTATQGALISAIKMSSAVCKKIPDEVVMWNDRSSYAFEWRNFGILTTHETIRVSRHMGQIHGKWNSKVSRRSQRKIWRHKHNLFHQQK